MILKIPEIEIVVTACYIKKKNRRSFKSQQCFVVLLDCVEVQARSISPGNNRFQSQFAFISYRWWAVASYDLVFKMIETLLRQELVFIYCVYVFLLVGNVNSCTFKKNTFMFASWIGKHHEY